jgi:hypothetical protein
MALPSFPTALHTTDMAAATHATAALLSSHGLKAIVAPSMLSSDFACLASEAKRILECGADWLHMDVMVSAWHLLTGLLLLLTAARRTGISSRTSRWAPPSSRPCGSTQLRFWTAT